MNRRRSFALFIGAVSLCGLASRTALAQTGAGLREPLPLEVAISAQRHNSRSPVDLSPDGQWVAHTVATNQLIPRDALGGLFAATGFPFGEGDARMQATLTNTRTGAVIRLGSPRSASWAAVWAPDGQRVAFYSDESGEAGVWIWERATGDVWRFPGVIARPFFGFEVMQWTSDGQRLLVKILPAGTTIAQANARPFERIGGPGLNIATRFPKVEPGQPSVYVRRYDAKQKQPEPARTGESRNAPQGEIALYIADLALLDLRTKRVERLVEGAPVRCYALSPDQKSVAYTVLKGWEANSQQANYDIGARELVGGAPRILATNVRMEYGFGWNWSPDGRTIGYIERGRLATGEIVLVSASGAGIRMLKGEGAPAFNGGAYETAPLWSADSQQLFALGAGKLWRVDAGAGHCSAVGSIPDWQIQTVVTPFGRPAVWSSDDGRTVWVIAVEREGANSGIYAIDLMTGQSRAALRENKTYSSLFNVDASDSTGEIAFVSSDVGHLHDVWMFNTKDGQARQATRLNPELDRYELGQSKIIEWRSLDGQPLRGALLLPPGYRPGQRIPLIVDVYGGVMASTYVNNFGVRSGAPSLNIHVLATRGYAALFPDAPLRPGRTMTDTVSMVMPGVNAAIEQGYVDPDRLAVMGQSYGSFNTLSIITQTNRFKAAVITAAALHPDLFADYLRNNTGYYETGQGNMRATIWEQRDRYFSNSPLFLFDRIETPLLIGQGEKDGDLAPAEAIFAALQRLGKTVEYRLYQGEEHVITQAPNVIDFWKRRLEFLAQHLDLTLDDKGAIVMDGARARSRSAARPASDQ
jgi:dipeptidyl aminopeptidase/acylaminoacyl peptidase